jgi:nucleoside-diphosphate-sugar epimerase
LIAPRRALVLGANGFIGRHLCVHLLSKGWGVDQVFRAGRADPIDASESGQARTFTIGPSGEGIGEVIARSGPDVIFNLAAAGVGRRIPYHELIDGNVGVVARVMESLDPGTTAAVVHAGSWSQYGSIDRQGDITEDQPLDPPTSYGSAKVAAELLGRTAGDEVGVPFMTLRLFNVYGPSENPKRLIPYVVRSLSAGSVARLTSGDQIRDFVYVDDVVRAFEACGTMSEPVTRSFNVATGCGTPVSEVVVRAARAAGGEERLLGFGLVSQRRTEPSRVVGDATALTQATGWTPQVPVSEGIEHTVRSILDARVPNV